MSFIPFPAGVTGGQGGAFFLIAYLMAWAGPRLEPVVRKYIEWLGWAIIVLAVIGF